MNSQSFILLLVRVFAITGVASTCIFLPFAPGGYDRLAVTFSMMVQVAAFGSLIFVPLGIIWFIFELKYPGKNFFWFGIACLIVSVIVFILPLLAAVGNDNLIFGFFALLAFIFILLRVFNKLRVIRKSPHQSCNPFPIYLICVPILVVLSRMTFIDKAVDFSTSRAITRSEKLISDIETFKTKNGYYPISLLSLWKDYEPNVFGVEQYHYESQGNAYNLFFEQMSSDLAARKIVMFNKLDEHVMTSHDMDILELSPENLDRQRGFFARRDLPQPHWKYFLFD